METTGRWLIAIEASLIMFICSAGVGCAQVFRSQIDHSGYVMIVGIPACAAAFFVAICCFFSDVIAFPRLQFPLPLTLPFIFSSLLPVCSLLLATPEGALMAPQAALSYARVWQRPLELAVVFCAQVIALSLGSLLHRPLP